MKSFRSRLTRMRDLSDWQLKDFFFVNLTENLGNQKDGLGDACRYHMLMRQNFQNVRRNNG